MGCSLGSRVPEEGTLGAPVVSAVLTGGVVHTFTSTAPPADTVVIRDGRVEWTGTRGDLPNVDGLPIVELGGKVVIPGMIDAHSHPALVAMSRWHVRLPETDDVEQLLDFIRDHGRRHPKEEAPFLYFEYYSAALFDVAPPTKELLDRAISDRPVLCQDGGDHASWVNSRMLELLGIDANTPDPGSGLERFARDENGEPTGYVLENAHVPLLPAMYRALGWSPPEDPSPETIAPVLDYLSSRGIVAVFDALIEHPDVVASMNELDRRGQLKMHYEGAVRFRSLEDLPSALDTAHDLDAERESQRVRVRTVKLFLDGTNELGSGAVIEPLLSSDNGGPRGAIQMDVDELVQCIALCNARGVDLHIHIVGDRAFRDACDAVEHAQQSVAQRGEVWRIQVTFAHCELIDPSDMHRPAELGIIINWTSHWSGGYFGDEATKHLGEERWNRMYDFNDIADAGAILTFSSDVVSNAELHRADPFFGMQIAATRVDPEVPLDPEKWPRSVRPSARSAIAVDRLLRGYIPHAAKQLRIDAEFGTIEPGRPAHLVLLDRDPYATAHSELARIVPMAVVFDGRLVSGSL